MLVFVTWIDSLLTQRWSVLHNVHQFTSHNYQASFLNTLVLHWTIIQGTSSPSVIVPNPSLHPPCWIVNRRKRICESACKVVSLNPSHPTHGSAVRSLSHTTWCPVWFCSKWPICGRYQHSVLVSAESHFFFSTHCIPPGWNCSPDLHCFRSRKK